MSLGFHVKAWTCQKKKKKKIHALSENWIPKPRICFKNATPHLKYITVCYKKNINMAKWTPYLA